MITPKIALIPFKHIKGASDIETGQIFLSDSVDIDCERQELAHVLSGDPDHGAAFMGKFNSLGGISEIVDHESLKQWRRRLGIPANICLNVGNVTGIQNVLTDLHLLAAYRKFSRKVLGTEGHWEVIGEVDGDSTKQLIRLYPTPKGAYPVTVLYYPSIGHFRSPQAKQLANDMLVAESKCILGRTLRKLTGLPSPDGGTIQYDGEALASEGQKEKDELIDKALKLGEPDRVFVW